MGNQHFSEGKWRPCAAATPETCGVKGAPHATDKQVEEFKQQEGERMTKFALSGTKRRKARKAGTLGVSEFDLDGAEPGWVSPVRDERAAYENVTTVDLIDQGYIVEPPDSEDEAPVDEEFAGQDYEDEYGYEHDEEYYDGELGIDPDDYWTDDRIERHLGLNR